MAVHGYNLEGIGEIGIFGQLLMAHDLLFGDLAASASSPNSAESKPKIQRLCLPNL